MQDLITVFGALFLAFMAFAVAAREVRKAHEIVARTNQETFKSVATLMDSFLHQAQGMQALAKLKDLEDEKVKKIFENFKAAPSASMPNMAKQIDEIKKRAERQGFTIDKDEAQKPQQESRTLFPPIPDPVAWEGAVIE
jgi:23S rRNA maturation mini-RNase III